MKEKIVIIGGGGHSKVIISIIKKLKNFEIVGYVDVQNKGELLGIPYLGDDNNLISIYKSGIKNAVIGIGQIKSNKIRKNIYDFSKEIGFVFPSIISPDAVVNENVKIGYGTVVMDGVIINTYSSIGECCIINTKSSIDHDCNIGNFTHIAPGVTISGNVNIGDNCLIGAGTTIIHSINIGSNIIVAAGSVVYRDINIPGTYIGQPLKRINS